MPGQLFVQIMFPIELPPCARTITCSNHVPDRVTSLCQDNYLFKSCSRPSYILVPGQLFVQIMFPIELPPCARTITCSNHVPDRVTSLCQDNYLFKSCSRPSNLLVPGQLFVQIMFPTELPPCARTNTCSNHVPDRVTSLCQDNYLFKSCSRPSYLLVPGQLFVQIMFPTELPPCARTITCSNHVPDRVTSLCQDNYLFKSCSRPSYLLVPGQLFVQIMFPTELLPSARTITCSNHVPDRVTSLCQDNYLFKSCSRPSNLLVPGQLFVQIMFPTELPPCARTNTCSNHVPDRVNSLCQDNYLFKSCSRPSYLLVPGQLFVQIMFPTELPPCDRTITCSNHVPDRVTSLCQDNYLFKSCSRPSNLLVPGQLFVQIMFPTELPPCARTNTCSNHVPDRVTSLCQDNYLFKSCSRPSNLLVPGQLFVQIMFPTELPPCARTNTCSNHVPDRVTSLCQDNYLFKSCSRPSYLLVPGQLFVQIMFPTKLPTCARTITCSNHVPDRVTSLCQDNYLFKSCSRPSYLLVPGQIPVQIMFPTELPPCARTITCSNHVPDRVTYLCQDNYLFKSCSRPNYLLVPGQLLVQIMFPTELPPCARTIICSNHVPDRVTSLCQDNYLFKSCSRPSYLLVPGQLLVQIMFPTELPPCARTIICSNHVPDRVTSLCQDNYLFKSCYRPSYLLVPGQLLVQIMFPTELPPCARTNTCSNHVPDRVTSLCQDN